MGMGTTPLDFGTEGPHIDPTQFPHNKGFPMKLKNVILYQLYA